MQDELPRASSHNYVPAAIGGRLIRLTATPDGPYCHTSFSMTFAQRDHIKELADRYQMSVSLVIRVLLEDALTAGEAIVGEALERSPRRVTA